MVDLDKKQMDCILHKEKPRTKPSHMPIKQLFSRDSLLTSMLINGNFRAIYHIMYALMLILVVDWLNDELSAAALRVASQNNSLLSTVTDAQNGYTILLQALVELSSWHRRNLARYLTGFGVTMLVWSGMMITTLIVPLAGFQLWVAMRQKLRHVVADCAGLFGYLAYQLLFIILPMKIVFYLSLPPTNGLIIMLEQARLLMKSHAIVRESVVNKVTQQANAERVQLHHVLYFLWAPTLIFRTEYPRTQSICWSFVRHQFGQFALCLLFGYCILTKHVFPAISTQFNSTGLAYFRLLTSIILPCVAISLLGFYAFLHCWLNAFAEITRFGERCFYLDWWNATDFRSSMRTWNKIVHDWLYTYVYRDVHLLCGNSTIGLIAVMLISGFFHEYILATALGFCYPAMFVSLYLFGMIAAFIRSNNPKKNLLIWILSYFNASFQLVSYSSEWYCRRKCQSIYGDERDFWVPFRWFCTLKNITK